MQGFYDITFPNGELLDEKAIPMKDYAHRMNHPVKNSQLYWFYVGNKNLLIQCSKNMDGFPLNSHMVLYYNNLINLAKEILGN